LDNWWGYTEFAPEFGFRSEVRTRGRRAGNSLGNYFWAQAGNSLRLLFAKHATCWQEKRLLIMPEVHQIDIHHVAKLARLALTEEEAGRFESQLDGILSYIDTLTQL
jgi:hypothetical protein